MYRLLDLFCGAGGCSVGYSRSGFEVVGVDHKTHPDYPFQFVQGDALSLRTEYLDQFDVVAASPPCPRYSTITPESTRHSHPDYLEAVRSQLQEWATTEKDRFYVIENVPGARSLMDHPIRVCGSWFGLGVRRHRYFESNLMMLRGTDCLHESQGTPLGVYGDHGDGGTEFLRPDGGRRGRKAADLDEAQQAMGIDWMTSWDDIADAVPPAYTQHIGEQLIEHLETS